MLRSARTHVRAGTVETGGGSGFAPPAIGANAVALLQRALVDQPQIGIVSPRPRDRAARRRAGRRSDRTFEHLPRPPSALPPKFIDIWRQRTQRSGQKEESQKEQAPDQRLKRESISRTGRAR